MSNQEAPTRNALDDKVNRLFAGKVVRKDLVRKVKVGANVPVFVLEYLHTASDDRSEWLPRVRKINREGKVEVVVRGTR